MAEDDPDTANLYKNLLESYNHKVDHVFNGRDSVDMYLDEIKRLKILGKEPTESAPYDVVLMDHMMPIMDGLQAAKNISQLNPKQRIIFLTAYVNETLLALISELGRVVELIRKPFEPEVLISMLEDLAPSSKLAELTAFAKSIFRLKNVGANDSRVRELLDLLKKIQTPGSI